MGQTSRITDDAHSVDYADSVQDYEGICDESGTSDYDRGYAAGYAAGLRARRKKQQPWADLMIDGEKAGTVAKRCYDRWYAAHKERCHFEPTDSHQACMSVFLRFLAKGFDEPSINRVTDYFFGWDKRARFGIGSYAKSFPTLYGILLNGNGRRG
jgi:hypothetical protein